MKNLDRLRTWWAKYRDTPDLFEDLRAINKERMKPMPCRSDYMESSAIEVHASRVLCLLEELETGRHVDPHSSSWRGYHPKVYNKTVEREKLDKLVAHLCAKIQERVAAKTLSDCSLELQIWWREHERMDRKREEQEEKQRCQEVLRRQALTKLSPDERQILGVDNEYQSTVGEIS